MSACIFSLTTCGVSLFPCVFSVVVGNVRLYAWPGCSLWRSLDNSLALQFELYLEYSIESWNDAPHSRFSTSLEVPINLQFWLVRKVTFGFSSLFGHFPLFLVFSLSLETSWYTSENLNYCWFDLFWSFPRNFSLGLNDREMIWGKQTSISGGWSIAVSGFCAVYLFWKWRTRSRNL